MLSYCLRRFVYMLIMLAVMSVVAFVLIQLPPGDYLTSYIMQLQASGQMVDQAQIASLRKQYGLDLPMYQQYFYWISNILKGDFGKSFDWNQPVNKLLAERLPVTLLVSLATLVFTYMVAIPIGIYSAVRQYSVLDYVFTFLGFIGIAIPNFLKALILMLLFMKYFGFSPGGLFSPQFIDAPWSLAKFIDLLKHLPIPIIVIGTADAAGLIRIMRGCLLDELKSEYVVSARAKGLKERLLLLKYPVRVALNPIISTIGWVLPNILSGATITAIVLDLPTIGALLYRALLSQDMYLASSCVMILTFFTLIGTFISDMLLAWVDPRIRYS
jgi:peptide/nickel transport system permease protein